MPESFDQDSDRGTQYPFSVTRKQWAAYANEEAILTVVGDGILSVLIPYPAPPQPLAMCWDFKLYYRTGSNRNGFVYF